MSGDTEMSGVTEMSGDTDLGRALIAECGRRLFDEGVPRLKTCLELLSEEEIWARPWKQTVSAGNLVTHLCGNVAQWICTGLGRRVDHRRREDEFAVSACVPRAQLVAHLDEVMSEARRVLDELDPQTLLEKRAVQCFQESGVSILVHVVEHFSYHVGQVTWIVKAHAGKQTSYYGGLDLDTTGEAGG